MRTLTKALVMTVALVTAAAAQAAHYSDFYVIPAAARTAGANNTLFRSDVAIYNFLSTPLTVELLFVESGEGNTDNVFPLSGTETNGSVTIPGNGSVLLTDVLEGYRRDNVGGAILIGADRPFAVTSRTYNEKSATETYGHTVQPVRDFLDNASGRTDNDGAVAYLPGLIANARFRTNIGMVAANLSGSATPMVVTVVLRNGAGAPLGNGRSFAIQSGAIIHVQFSSSSITATPFDVASGEVRITQGNGAVAPYATVVDNGSGDAVYIDGVFPKNMPSPSASKTTQRSIFREVFDRVRASSY